MFDKDLTVLDWNHLMVPVNSSFFNMREKIKSYV